MCLCLGLKIASKERVNLMDYSRSLWKIPDDSLYVANYINTVNKHKLSVKFVEKFTNI